MEDGAEPGESPGVADGDHAEHPEGATTSRPTTRG